MGFIWELVILKLKTMLGFEQVTHEKWHTLISDSRLYTQTVNFKPVNLLRANRVENQLIEGSRK